MGGATRYIIGQPTPRTPLSLITKMFSWVTWPFSFFIWILCEAHTSWLNTMLTSMCWTKINNLFVYHWYLHIQRSHRLIEAQGSSVCSKPFWVNWYDHWISCFYCLTDFQPNKTKTSKQQVSGFSCPYSSCGHYRRWVSYEFISHFCHCVTIMVGVKLTFDVNLIFDQR